MTVERARRDIGNRLPPVGAERRRGPKDTFAHGSRTLNNYRQTGAGLVYTEVAGESGLIELFSGPTACFIGLPVPLRTGAYELYSNPPRDVKN